VRIILRLTLQNYFLRMEDDKIPLININLFSVSTVTVSIRPVYWSSVVLVL